MLQKKPDFIFVGPQRTGTTWVYNQLKHYQDLCFPKGVKETMFFDRNFNKGSKWYSWHFKHKKENQLVGEIAPSYFNHPKAPKRIKQYSPNCKIIISLRDPVERARSLFQHHYQKGRVGDSFTDAIEKMPEIVSAGFYKDHIERWLHNFGHENLLILSMKGIIESPDEMLLKIYKFLDINEHRNFDSNKEDKVNSALAPRFSWLAKIGSETVIKLHSLRLHWIVNLFKKMGLKKFFFKASDEKPELTREEIAYLEKEYKTHLEYIHSQFPEIQI